MFWILLVVLLMTIAVPAISFLNHVLKKEIKFLDLCKGVLGGLVLNQVFLPVLLEIILKMIVPSDFLKTMLCVILYSLVNVGLFLFFVFRVFQLREKQGSGMIFGFAIISCLPFIHSCFTNLVYFDHIRINDFSFFSNLGFTSEQVSKLVTSFSINNMLFYIEAGLIGILTFLLVRYVCQLLQKSDDKNILVFSVICIVLLNMISLYAGQNLFVLFLMVLAVLVCVLFQKKYPFCS